jgi:hypothetical protein
MKTKYEKERLEKAIKLFSEATYIVGSLSETVLKNNYGIDLKKLPESRNIKYHPSCPKGLEDGQNEPAIIAKLFNAEQKVVGFYIYYIRLEYGFEVTKKNQTGVIILGKEDSKNMLAVKDLITGLKVAQGYDGSVCIFINSINLKYWFPNITTTKRIDLFAPNEIAFKQLSYIGSKTIEYWEARKIDIVFRQLTKTDINCKYLQSRAKYDCSSYK